MEVGCRREVIGSGWQCYLVVEEYNDFVVIYFINSYLNNLYILNVVWGFVRYLFKDILSNEGVL